MRRTHAVACTRIVPRNTASHVPMYGCVGMDDGPPMLVTYLVDWEFRPHDDWLHWLVHHSGPTLSSVLHIGGDARWPTTSVDAARVQRLLPLLCSIGRRPDGVGTVLPTPWARRATGCAFRTRRRPPGWTAADRRPSGPRRSVASWTTWPAGVACLARVGGRLRGHPPSAVVRVGGGPPGVHVRAGCRLGVPGVVTMAHAK